MNSLLTAAAAPPSALRTALVGFLGLAGECGHLLANPETRLVLGAPGSLGRERGRKERSNSCHESFHPQARCAIQWAFDKPPPAAASRRGRRPCSGYLLRLTATRRRSRSPDGQPPLLIAVCRSFGCAVVVRSQRDRDYRIILNTSSIDKRRFHISVDLAGSPRPTRTQHTLRSRRIRDPHGSRSRNCVRIARTYRVLCCRPESRRSSRRLRCTHRYKKTYLACRRETWALIRDNLRSRRSGRTVPPQGGIAAARRGSRRPMRTGHIGGLSSCITVYL